MKYKLLLITILLLMLEVYFLTFPKHLIKSDLLAFYSNYKLMALMVSYFLWWKIILKIVNGQTSEWREINSGVLQGSVLGPLFFLIYINDLPHGITSICKIFAWITSICKILILIPINRLMKSYFLEIEKFLIIPLLISTITMLKNVLIRNI